MTDQPQAKRGEAAWKEQREALAKRNADAHKRGKAERQEHDRFIEARTRVRAAREADLLDELNARIVKRRAAAGPA